MVWEGGRGGCWGNSIWVASQCVQICFSLTLLFLKFFFDRTRGKTNLEEKLAPWSSWNKINYNCKLKRVISILQAPLIHLGTY